MIHHPKSLTGKTILVVEDDWLLAELIVQELQSHGAEVLGPIASCSETMSILRDDTEFDSAILDVNLLDGEVYEAADLLIERGANFVFASSVARADLPTRYSHIRLFRKPLEMNRYLQHFSE